jgi:hypothetical protein
MVCKELKIFCVEASLLLLETGVINIATSPEGWGEYRPVLFGGENKEGE